MFVHGKSVPSTYTLGGSLSIQYTGSLGSEIYLSFKTVHRVEERKKWMNEGWKKHMRREARKWEEEIGGALRSLEWNELKMVSEMKSIMESREMDKDVVNRKEVQW